MESAAEYRQREVDARDRAKLVTRCAFCRWRYTGTALEGRERALQHRLEHHPEARRRTRYHKGRHLARYVQPPMSREEAEEVMVEVKRRAFLNGVDLPSESVTY